MEQTLGKRIAENRKRMKLTQDQLAEKLGITAQAVSKWENDQSCPDITMLPRLAEIFGITTDSLLGCAAAEQTVPVHEAEVVEECDTDDSGIHLQWDSDKPGGKWEFHWDSGKRHAITFALFVLLVGGLYLASRLLDWDVTFWSILWPSFMVVYALQGLLRKFSVFNLGVLLFGGYSLVHNLGIWQLDIAEELIFPIMIVLFGLGLLIDAMKKPSKPRFRVTRNGKNISGGSEKTKYTTTNSGTGFNCSLSFGEKTHQVNLPVLECGDATVSFGELTVDLTGCEAVSQGCSIMTNCSFGELNLLVPRKFRVEPQANTSFASVDISGHPDSETAGVIYLDANVSFGEITVRYI